MLYIHPLIFFSIGQFKTLITKVMHFFFFKFPAEVSCERIGRFCHE